MPSKILIVEDNSDMRDLLAVVLQLEGHLVCTANDGNEGIKLVQSDCPDLILSDINMPNLDGVEMIRRVRLMPAGNKIPILMMSALGNDDLTEAINAGANQALRKPVEMERMVKTVKHLLEWPQRDLKAPSGLT